MLSGFLRKSLGEPFVWGERDCALWACSWIALRRGIDPGKKWRGVCTSERHAFQIIRDGGGLLSICREAFGAAGLSETEHPQPGDVGVIATPVGEAVVIRTDLGWAWKSTRGIAVIDCPHLAAWRV